MLQFCADSFSAMKKIKGEKKRMKKVVLLAAVLTLGISGAAWAAKSAASAPVKAASTALSAEVSAVQKLENMKPVLAYDFLMDFKLFDLSNPNFASSDGSSSWYFYPTYRAVLSNVFNNGFAILADIEKPGYASITYPTVKINELYGKYQQGDFYVKFGRQVFGDTSDLLLGFQNDALTAGFLLDAVDLQFFLAKTDLLMPWGGSLEGMLGFVPTFSFGPDMGLKGYLLIGTQSITVTSGTPATTSDKVNALITLGGKYFLDMPVSETGKFDLAGQLGLQFAMAQDAAAQSIDATNVGLKLDAGYGNLPPNALGFKVGGHVVFTGGVDTTATSIKAPFVSANALIGSGPGLFSKVENGAGTYTYLDAFNGNAQIQQYQALFALGLSGEISISAFNAGVGFWTFMDTNRYDPAPSSNSMGSEFDEFASYQILPALSVYQQFAVFIPSNPANLSPAPGSAIKFLVGSALKF